MGLDSVELLVEVEKYFNIQITNSDAAKINTVQSMVDMVCQYLNISSADPALRDMVFGRASDCIAQLYPDRTTIQLSDSIAKQFPAQTLEEWKSFEGLLGLRVPIPGSFLTREASWHDSLSQMWQQASPPSYQWEDITISQFINAICACNCYDLIDRTHVTSSYEVYLVVIRITASQTGADYYEISPEKSFTDDLGID